MAADLETIVQRMIDAGEPEDNIAAVIREFKGMGETEPAQSSRPQADSPNAYPIGAAAGASLAAAPAVVRGMNAAADPAGRLAASRLGRGSAGVAALDAAGRVMRGDYKGAAIEGAAAGAAAAVPRTAAAVERATAPASVRPSAILDAGGKVMSASVPGGFISRLAGAISRFAGPAAAAGLAYDLYRAGQDAAARGEKIGSLPTTEDIAREIIANQNR